MYSLSFSSRLVRLDARVVVGLITLLGAILRVYHLDYKALWFDEAVIYWIAKGNLGEVIAQNAAQNSAPPLYVVLLSLVIKIGDSENALRAISCLGGIASIPAIYLLARKFMPRPAAYFCSFVTAIALPQVSYSQQLREYSLAFLLATLMVLCFYNALKTPNWKNWGLLTLAFVIAVFTQYGLALLIFSLDLIFLAVCLFKVSSTYRKPLFTYWIVSQALTFLAVVAVYFLSLKQQMQPGGFGASEISDYLAGSYWDGSISSLTRLVFRNTFRIFAFAFPPVWALLPLFLLGLVVTRRNRMALLLLLVPFVCVFLAACARKYPYDGARQIMFLLPMVYVFAGLGFNYLAGLKGRQLWVPLALIVVAATGLMRTRGYLNRTSDEDMRPAVKLLQASVKPDDAIYVYYGAKPAFDYYYRSTVGQRTYGTPNRLHPQSYATEIAPLVSEHNRIWMMFSHPYGKEREIITNAVAQKRQLKLVHQLKNSWLYVAN